MAIGKPADFGAYFWNFAGDTSGLDRETYIADWESFYTFNNVAPQRPFLADSTEVLNLLPIERTTLAEWASQQNWRQTKL